MLPILMSYMAHSHLSKSLYQKSNTRFRRRCQWAQQCKILLQLLTVIVFQVMFDTRQVQWGVAACNGYFTDFCDNFEAMDGEEPTSYISSFHNSSASLPSSAKRMDGEPMGLILSSLNRTKRAAGSPSFQPFRNERELSKQISSILDTLFNSGYDHQIRPRVGTQPLEVEVNIAIRSMGPVDEQKQIFSMDCYFRQYWTDFRLRYNNTRLRELPMNWQFLNKIWRPDTFFFNGKRSYLHKMTVPNRFIRIAPDGRVSYSQRLTIKARCQMDLRKFPLDTQECPLEIGSFGHDSDEIIYKWSAKPLSMDKLGLAQYNLINWTFGAFSGEEDSRNISKVFLNFKFERQQGFYLLQIYIPLTLIVMCSWVTFWLRKTAKGSEIPARTSLGASSVLSVVTIGFGGKSKPQVGYATALDVFIILCFLEVFAALVEFAFLNFLDTLVRRLKRKDKDCKLVMLMAQHDVMHGRIPQLPERQESTIMDTDGICTEEDILTPPDSTTPCRDDVFNFNGRPNDLLRALDEDRDAWTRFLDCIIRYLQFFNCCRSIRKTEMFQKPQVVFNRVDSCSRKLFPFTFLLLNVLYWYGYMYWF